MWGFALLYRALHPNKHMIANDKNGIMADIVSATPARGQPSKRLRKKEKDETGPILGAVFVRFLLIACGSVSLLTSFEHCPPG